MKGAFHGRTERPALYSDSSRKDYMQNLASFRDEDSLITVEPYNVDALQKAFADADRNGWFIEAMFLEPVMGEGDPGRGVPASFYAAARELTKAHGSLFLVDSIQAGLRAHGVLSIVDYPGFEGHEAPDMETYSKALNAGAVPAVGARRHRARGRPVSQGHLRQHDDHQSARARRRLRRAGAADAGTARQYPRARQGSARQARGAEGRNRRPDHQGPGHRPAVLVRACAAVQVLWRGSTEEWMRERGIGVIHGGANSLRFTPHFAVTADELDLVVRLVGRALREGPRQQQAAAA